LYYKVSTLDNVNYRDFEEVLNIPGISVIKTRDGIKPYENWQKITEDEYNEIKDELGILKKAIVNVSPNNTTTTNTTLVLTFELRNWKGDLAINETVPVLVSVKGPGQPVNQEVLPVNGLIEFEFISSVTGIYEIHLTGPRYEDFILEVTVYE